MNKTAVINLKGKTNNSNYTQFTTKFYILNSNFVFYGLKPLANVYFDNGTSILNFLLFQFCILHFEFPTPPIDKTQKNINIL